VNNNSELDVWRDAWQAPREAPPVVAKYDLRRETRRQERWLRARYVFSCVFALGLLIFSVYAVHRNMQGLLWAAVVWLTTFIALGFSIWNWRTLWNATSASTSEFAALYEKRCLATLRAVRFGYAFLAMQLAIVIPWLSWDFHRGGTSGNFGLVPYLRSMGLLVCLSAIFIFSFARTKRRTLMEVGRLKECQRDDFVE
jgi:hypothetical protein